MHVDLDRAKESVLFGLADGFDLPLDFGLDVLRVVFVVVVGFVCSLVVHCSWVKLRGILE